MDADTPRTERAHDVPGTTPAAWRRHACTDARDTATRRSPYLAVPRPPPRVLVLLSPRVARRTRSRHPLAPTVAGEDNAARHGRGSTRKDPTSTRTPLPRRSRSQHRHDVVNTIASSPSPLASRRRRTRDDPHHASQHLLKPINRAPPGQNQAHHHDHHSPPLRLAPVATSIDAGAAPIGRSEPRKLWCTRRRSRPPRATPLLQAASPSSTTSSRPLPTLAGAPVSRRPPTAAVPVTRSRRRRRRPCAVRCRSNPTPHLSPYRFGF